MPITLHFEGEDHELDILARQPQLRCRVGTASHAISEAAAPDDDCWLLTVDGRQYRVWRVCEGERVHLKIGERTYSVGVVDPLDASQQGISGDELRADMPGVVVALRCQPGDQVRAFDALLTIESMKMQITLNAPRDGVVAAVHIAVNQPFQKGALLIALQKHPETDPT